jgi:hypothetical protein
MSGVLLERFDQGAIPIALEAVSNTMASLAAARFYACEKRCQRESVDLFQLEFPSTVAQPGEQDIQVAHFSEQAGNPFQLALDSSAPWLVDEMFKRMKLTPQAATGGSQAVHSFWVALPRRRFVAFQT